MTPKEKAEYLINKFEDGDLECSTDYGGCSFIDTKQCALIAVDEILNLCWNGNLKAKEYWQEVKQEIENL